jgi:hypothetical protein
MQGKLGSNIDKDFKKSSFLFKEQVYLPYDTELLSILNKIYGKVAITVKSIHFYKCSSLIKKYYDILAYSHFLNKFKDLFTDITERKKYENELKDTIKKLQKSISETIKDTEIHFHGKE